jgi:hypothetical protein
VLEGVLPIAVVVAVGCAPCAERMAAPLDVAERTLHGLTVSREHAPCFR